MRQILGAFLALGCCLPALSQVAGQRKEPAARAESLQKRWQAAFAGLARPDTPGFAVSVTKAGEVLFADGFGVRDLRGKERIDARTNFRLASCSKQFTAMSIMLLVHDGQLGYDAKLTDVFPEFPGYGKAITIRHLLNHTSGLPDYEDLMIKAETPRNSWIWTPERQIQDHEVLKLLEQESGGKFLPGSQWSYSNSGYVLLGLIVAKVSGKSFPEFLRDRIFVPLQMHETLAYVRGKREIANRSYGHSKQGAAWKQTDQSPTSATLGDGGVYSSLKDLAKWDEALANHTLLSDAEMQPANLWTTTQEISYRLSKFTLAKKPNALTTIIRKAIVLSYLNGWATPLTTSDETIVTIAMKDCKSTTVPPNSPKT